MSRKFLTPIDLVQNELQNARVQNLATAPGTPVKGQLYYDTTPGDDTLYWYDGSAWVAAKGGAGTTLGSSSSNQAFGDSQIPGISTDASRADHKHGIPALPVASETVAGIAELATQAETNTGTDDVRVLTPLKMFTYVGTHLSDATDAHAASAIGFTPGGTIAASNVQTAIAEVATDAQSYADALVAGLSYKEAVRAATTANGTLASAFQNGATIDAVTLATGDRILVKDQSTGPENGIYTVNASGAPTRAADANAVGELEGAYVFVIEGTANGDKQFVCSTNGPITPGTTATTWVLYGAGTTYTAGNGLTLSGATFDVVPLNGSIVVAADSIAVGFAGSGSAVTAAKSDHDHSGTYAPVAHTHDATYAKVVAQDCAAAVTTTVTHNFNTRDVKVEVYRTTTPWDTVDCDIERPTVNSVTATFATAPAAAAFRIVVEGIDQ